MGLNDQFIRYISTDENLGQLSKLLHALRLKPKSGLGIGISQPETKPNLAEEKANALTPQRGRNKSRERVARIDMLSVLLTIFTEYCPNMKKKDFNIALEEIYLILSIPVNELSRDINESRQHFINNKNYYKTQFLHSIRT